MVRGMPYYSQCADNGLQNIVNTDLISNVCYKPIEKILLTCMRIVRIYVFVYTSAYSTYLVLPG